MVSQNPILLFIPHAPVREAEPWHFYSVTIRPGTGYLEQNDTGVDGIDLGLINPPPSLSYLTKFPCYSWSIEKENTLGEHLQCGVATRNLSDPKRIREKLLTFYPNWTTLQRRHAIKVERHHCWQSLFGYCLKEDNDKYGFEISKFNEYYTKRQLIWIYKYMAKTKAIRLPRYIPDFKDFQYIDQLKQDIENEIEWSEEQLRHFYRRIDSLNR